MMKFFVLAALIVVSMADSTVTIESKESCDAGVVEDGGISCTECFDTSSAACKTTLAVLPPTNKVLSCVAFVECLKKADEDKANKAAADSAAKYGKYCPTDKAKCRDLDNECPKWASASPSQCTSNPDWMLPNCMKSCCPICTGKNTLAAGTCPLKDRKDLCVKNTQSSCADWAKAGECDKNAGWMKVNCMQSCCDTCKTAADGCPTVKATCANSYATPNATAGDSKCIEWGKAGECTSNPVWMKKNCGKSCCTICQPKSPARSSQPLQRIVYQQPVYQQPIRIAQPQPVVYQQPVYQQPVRVQPQPVVLQPQPVVQQRMQPIQVQQPIQRVQFGGYQTAPGLPFQNGLQRGLPYMGR